MVKDQSQHDRGKIAFVQTLIDAGLYEQYFQFEEADCIVAERVHLRILAERLAKCEIGDGNGYRDVVADVLVRSLDSIVDPEYVRLDPPCANGEADIELPLALERLGHNLLFQIWTNRYDLRSIVVEVKNQQDPCPVGHVDQLFRYLDSNDYGRFGLIVSRSRFTKNALRELRDTAARGEKLMLPLGHQDLHDLISARAVSSSRVMQHLRRLETRLRQVT